MKLTVIGALTAFLAIATPAVLAAETFIPPPGSWWIGDELDTALPPRFTLNATSPKGELDGYSFIISTELLGPLDLNFRLAPADFKNINHWAMPAVFIGQGTRFYFENVPDKRHFYMEALMLQSSATRFRDFDSIHFHAGYTFDGFSMWHNRLVRRWDMNRGYQEAPHSLWYACDEYDTGEMDLVWDSASDTGAPGYVQSTTKFEGLGCIRVELVITAV